jgi:hypothetical protein
MFQFWSQLRLAPSFSAPGFATNNYRANGRSIYLGLEWDSGSDVDLSNVKPPDGISPVSFKSVQVSLAFSQVPAPPERPQKRSKEASPSFEDLLSPEWSDQMRGFDQKVAGRQRGEHEIMQDFEVLLDQSPYYPVALLYDVDDLLDTSRSFKRTNSESLRSMESNFHLLQKCSPIYPSRIPILTYRVREDMALPGEQPSSKVTPTNRTATSSSVSTFECLEPHATSSVRKAGQPTISSPSSTALCREMPPRENLALYQSVLSLTDAALRTLIHPQPTRLSAGIKLSNTNSAFDPRSSHDRQRPTALSQLAPQIFTPGYSQAVVERAGLVPGIANSLATFLRHRCGPESDETCGAKQQGRSKEDDGVMQDKVKETLRRHVWMTMTNGLRSSHSERARKLPPLAMPCPWRGTNSVDGALMAVEEDMEMLETAPASRPLHPSHGEKRAEETMDKGLECGLVYDFEGEFEEDLLLDDMEADLSCVEDEFEEACLFGKGMDLDSLGGCQEEAGREAVGESDYADNVEEMLL